MRIAILLGAIALGGIASADIPPPMPENPLGADCQPFIGLWARDTAQEMRRAHGHTVLAIDSTGAVMLSYINQQDINIEAQAKRHALTCKAEGNGVTRLDFGTGDYAFSIEARLIDETHFTVIQMSTWTGNGAPPEQWEPEPQVVSWTRLGR